MGEADADDEGETEMNAANASKAKKCIERINKAIAELMSLECADAVDALVAQLQAIDLHREVALDLIKKLRPEGVNRLLGVDPVDLFIIVHLDAQTAPVSQNSIVSAIRNRYPERRADCAARLRRLEEHGVIGRSKTVRGRGGGIRWVLSGSNCLEAAKTMQGVERRTDEGLEPLPSWWAGENVYVERVYVERDGPGELLVVKNKP